MIKGWGLGVNRIEPIELTLDLDEPKPDAFLLAGRCTPLDHDRALERLLPTAVGQDVDLVVGGPYSSGILAGGTHFAYQDAPAHIVKKVTRIKQLAERHGISVKAAALQFALAHPATAAVIPGPRPSTCPYRPSGCGSSSAASTRCPTGCRTSRRASPARAAGSPSAQRGRRRDRRAARGLRRRGALVQLRLEWSGTFTPTDVSEDEVVALFHGIYADGLAALQNTLEG